MPEQNQTVTFKSDGIVGGEQSLREILVALNASAGTGTAAEVIAGTPVFDSNGKLVRVQIVPPSASNTTQIVEALQNPGVAEVQTCFPQLVLNDISGIVIGGGFPALITTDQVIVARVDGGGILGFLNSAGYTDRATLSSALPVLISVQNASSTDIVVPVNATITLNYVGGPTIFTVKKAFTVEAGDLVNRFEFVFFTDDQGNLFARFASAPDAGGNFSTVIPPEPDYLVACQDPLRAF